MYPWLILEMDHDDHIVPRGFPSRMKEVPQKQEGSNDVTDVASEVRSRLRAVLRIADRRTQGSTTDTVEDSDSSVDSPSSTATSVRDFQFLCIE